MPASGVDVVESPTAIVTSRDAAEVAGASDGALGETVGRELEESEQAAAIKAGAKTRLATMLRRLMVSIPIAVLLVESFKSPLVRDLIRDATQVP